MAYTNKEDLYAAQLKHRRRNRAAACLYLLDHPCVMCGETDIRKLDFDHLDPTTKKYDVGRAISGSHRAWTTILKEIKKCQVLCTGCHRVKTIGEPLWFTDLQAYLALVT